MRYQFEVIDFLVQFVVGLVLVFLADLSVVLGVAFVEACLVVPTCQLKHFEL